MLKRFYPNDYDIRLAKSLGRNPFSHIMIHGIHFGLGWIKSFHTLIYWTLGYVAVTNEEIEEIYNAVDIRTKVVIEP